MRENAAKRSGGRPSRAQAEQIEERILETATGLFLTHGYGTTSIEAIAQQAGISKRTFYHRFEDKAELLGAVVQRLIGRMRPPDTASLFKGKTLESILHTLGGIILRAALAPEALALHRLIVAEAFRFPELCAALNAEGSREEAITRIALLLEREISTLKNPRFAAEQFLHMIISVPQQRAIGLGTPMPPPEMDAWVSDTVALFLRGCTQTGA